MNGQMTHSMTKTNKQEIYKYGEPFYCDECGKEAMYMDKDKKFACYGGVRPEVGLGDIRSGSDL